jgi:hypothetical protein
MDYSPGGDVNYDDEMKQLRDQVNLACLELLTRAQIEDPATGPEAANTFSAFIRDIKADAVSLGCDEQLAENFLRHLVGGAPGRLAVRSIELDAYQAAYAERYAPPHDRGFVDR